MDIEDIEFLRALRFPWTKIANLLNISRSTLYRRLEENCVSREVYFTEISDRELDRIILRIKLDHPNDGERMMSGHLVSRGIFVQRTRLGASIHRVDPANTALRRSIAIRRRVYFAEGPNAVWHLDGNHKPSSGQSRHVVAWGGVTLQNFTKNSFRVVKIS